MFAIVDIAGQQFKVKKGQKVFVHRLADEVGKNVEFKNVLLINDDVKTHLGTALKNSSVKASVVSHLKGDKVLVFKKKRRKGYQKLNGHRQCFTQIEISDIVK